MKALGIFTLILASLLLGGCSDNDPLKYEPISFPVTDEITGIDFTDGSHGCVVTAVGDVFLTTNGKSFAKTASFGRRLSDVCFLDDDIGIAFGAGLLARTNDGGQTWTAMSCDSTYLLDDCVFAKDNRGILVGAIASGDHAGHGLIGISDDEALTFRWDTTEFSGFTDIDDVPPSHAWILGDGVLLYTTDNGQTWEHSTHRVQGSHQVYFTDVQHGWEVGDNGLLRYSSDGGWSWQDKLKMTEEPLLCVTAPEIDIIYIAGNRFVAVSTNHGRQWVKDSATYPVKFNDLDWVGGHIFVAGSGGTLMKLDL
ncbi:MAG: hypothetical protein IT585_13700 [candidate division Zixibacteria bacterium]|nr:hypothetical protein [candidate division Zixibacteria bacterium]